MPRSKLIIDNDFGGDPDGLFQLAHHLLSPSADILGVINSHVMPNDPNWPTFGDSIKKGLDDLKPIYQMTGTAPLTFGGLHETALDHSKIVNDETLDFLVSTTEAANEELLYICGGPMTQLARLINAKPKNLENLKVLWIGGSEYSGNYPPGASTMEYNLAADVESVQIVFNNPELTLWHIPRDSYRRCVVSFAELNARLAGHGALAEHLLGTLRGVKAKTAENGIDIGETYCLGDSSLVLLSVLENSFEPTPAGSDSELVSRRAIGQKGEYLFDQGFAIHKTRVFGQLDARLMFEDMFHKLGGANATL